MRSCKTLSVLVQIALPLLLVVGAYLYCRVKSGDFALSQILSDVETTSHAEVFPEDVKPLLEQTFTFFGSGDQSYAFLGEDGTTILKLFRHFDEGGRRSLAPIFDSCRLAFEELKEETGLIYLHLGKSTPALVRLIDPLGRTHTVDPNATEYVLQKKADSLICPALLGLYKRGKIDRLKAHIRSLFQLIASRSAKGIGDRDTALRRNFGYLGKRAIAIDIGSLYRDETLKEPERSYAELQIKTKRLYRWLKKHAPELVPFYEETLASYAPP